MRQSGPVLVLWRSGYREAGLDAPRSADCGNSNDGANADSNGAGMPIESPGGFKQSLLTGY